MSLTSERARRIRIWVITACIILGAALPFVIPGAVVVRQFTDIEARIGFGTFAVILHALIGALIGAGLAEFVVWARGGARDVSKPRDHSNVMRPPDGFKGQ